MEEIDESDGEEEFNRDVSVILSDLEILDCPICFEPLNLPVFQCQNGHIACGSCCKKLKHKCGNCSLQIGHIRCRVIEAVIESVKIPCRYTPHGCSQKLLYKEKLEHEKSCEWCPSFDCDFVGKSSYFIKHTEVQMASRGHKGKSKVGESSHEPPRSKKIQNKACIKERLFKLKDFGGEQMGDIRISPHPFMARYIANKWEKFVSDLPNGNPTVVSQFYETFNKTIGIEGSRGHYHTTVNGKRIQFSPEVIENFLCVDRVGVENIPIVATEHTPNSEVLQWALTTEAYERNVIQKSRYDQADLAVDAWYLQLWAAGSLYPTSTLTTVSIAHLRGIYAIYRGQKLDLGAHIFTTICHYAGTMPTSKCMPYPCIITGICESQKVPIPPAGNTLTHGDRLTTQSLNSRFRQLKAKRQRVDQQHGRVDTLDNEDEMMWGEPNPEPIYTQFESTVLDMFKGLDTRLSRFETCMSTIETSQQDIVRNQGKILIGQEEERKATTQMRRELKQMRQHMGLLGVQDSDDAV